MRRRIGAGAFATVWLAYDEQLDCPVAIKVLADNWTEDQHVRQRFIEEGRFLRKVESPHIVSVYDAGELEDSRPFLVMSYADQGTLADRLELEPLTVSQSLHVIGQVGAGLHALHQRGVLHRDVKPANVLFRTVEVGGERQVSAMLGDLGLGKAMDMSSRLTMIGGTPSFIAPEQAQGEPLDGRADQYSLAALAYLMLAGRAPYDHVSLSAAADPGPLPPLDNGLPDDAEKVLATALSKDRGGRYPDVPSFVEALDSALVDHTEEPPTWIAVDEDLTRPEPRVDSNASPRRAQRVRAAAGASALVVGLVAGYSAQRLVATEQTIWDSTNSISVTVPDDWTRVVDAEPWRAPGGTTDEPSVAAGDAEGWNGITDPGEGIFIGVLPGESLPTGVPERPECGASGGAVPGRHLGGESITVEFTGCSDDGGITIERTVQVNADQLLRVQVRAGDRAVAYDVIDSITTPGL